MSCRNKYKWLLCHCQHGIHYSREINALNALGNLIGYYERKNKSEELQTEILMQLAQGYDFDFYRLNDIVFSLVEYVDVILNALKAIKNLHDHRILHRDIKGTNFIFDRANANVVLIDFNLSVAMSSENSYFSTKGAGSPKYSAPELRAKDNKTDYEKTHYNEKTEIYSAGKFAMELLFRSHGKKTNSTGDEFGSARIFMPSLTKQKIADHLKTMIDPHQANRPDFSSTINVFQSIRDNLDDLSKVISVCCIEVEQVKEMMNESDFNKQSEFIHMLKHFDMICLVDENQKSVRDYLSIQQWLKKHALTVLSSLVLYNNAAELGMSIRSCLNMLAANKVRIYTPIYILNKAARKNFVLQAALNANGICYYSLDNPWFGMSVAQFGLSVKQKTLDKFCAKLEK